MLERKRQVTEVLRRGKGARVEVCPERSRRVGHS